MIISKVLMNGVDITPEGVVEAERMVCGGLGTTECSSLIRFSCNIELQDGHLEIMDDNGKWAEHRRALIFDDNTLEILGDL